MKLQVVEKLEEEVRKLEQKLRVELPRQIKTALKFGDLRENAEYHAALERQEHVKLRLQTLRDRLDKMRMLSKDNIPKDTAAYGSTLELIEEGKEGVQTFHLVTSEDADLDSGRISLSSPLGSAFLGKTEGDEIEVRTPGGIRRFEIQSLKTIHDQ